MVLNQCMVKGCHSSSSTDSLEVGSSGGHLQPVPKEVIENVAIEKKWIELIKVNKTDSYCRICIIKFYKTRWCHIFDTFKYFGIL